MPCIKGKRGKLFTFWCAGAYIYTRPELAECRLGSTLWFWLKLGAQHLNCAPEAIYFHLKATQFEFVSRHTRFRCIPARAKQGRGALRWSLLAFARR